MYKSLSPAFFIITVILSCSNPTIVKQQTIGGNEDDELRSMCVTKDGGFIIGGFSFSDISGEKTINNHGVIYSDFWIIKFDKNAKPKWQKCLGGLQGEFLRSIASTDDGGCVIAGDSHSDISGDKTGKLIGSVDIWIIKLDSIGNIQWDKTIGGSGSDICHAIRQTKDKGYIIGGASNSNISGDKTENCRGDFDIWVIMLDSTGKVKWDKTLGGNKFEFCGGLELTGDEGIIVCGNSASDISDNKKEKNKGIMADGWIVKLDIKGNIQWEQTFGGNDDEMFLGICKTSDDGFFLSAFSKSNRSGDKSENSRGGWDIWLVKIDSSCKKIMDKTIGGKGDDFPAINESIHQTQDGGYIIGGFSNSKKSGDKTDSCRGGSDYWIIKLDKTTKIKWAKTIGGFSDDELWNIVEIEKNHFVLAGTSSSNVSGDNTDSSRGKKDYWIVFLNE